MYKKNKDLPYEQQAKLLIHHYDQLVDRRSLDSARRRIKELLNQSIVPKGTGPIESREITIKEYGEFDLSRLDVSQLREQFGKAECKNLEIDDLQGFIEQKLNAKLSQNSERKSFAEAFQEIINRYNAGSIETEQAFDELMKLFSRMSEEQRRASQEGLSEQELEIFDILRKENSLKKTNGRLSMLLKIFWQNSRSMKQSCVLWTGTKKALKSRHSISSFVIRLTKLYQRVMIEQCSVKNMKPYVLSLSVKQLQIMVCYSQAKY